MMKSRKEPKNAPVVTARLLEAQRGRTFGSAFFDVFVDGAFAFEAKLGIDAYGHLMAFEGTVGPSYWGGDGVVSFLRRSGIPLRTLRQLTLEACTAAFNEGGEERLRSDMGSEAGRLAAEASLILAEVLPLAPHKSNLPEDEQVNWHEEGWAEAQRQTQRGRPATSSDIADRVVAKARLREGERHFWSKYRAAQEGAQDYLNGLEERDWRYARYALRPASGKGGWSTTTGLGAAHVDPGGALEQAFRDLQPGQTTRADGWEIRRLRAHERGVEGSQGAEEPLPARGGGPKIECLAVSPDFQAKSPNVEVMGRLGVERLPKQRREDVSYTCECPLEPGETRKRYLVTGTNGDKVQCRYCDDCAELARSNWTGETASIVPLDSAERLPAFRQGVRDRLGPEPGIEVLHPVPEIGPDASMQFRHRGGGYLGSEAVPGYYLDLGGLLKLLKSAEEPSDAGHKAAMAALGKLIRKLGGSGRESLPAGGTEYLRSGSTRMSSAEPGKFIVQTILFEDEHFNKSSAEAWAKGHGFAVEKVAHEGNHWRVRQMDPDLFDPDTFRTKQIAPGIKLVLARLA